MSEQSNNLNDDIMKFGPERIIPSRSGLERAETVHWVWCDDPLKMTYERSSFSKIDSAVVTQGAWIGNSLQVSVNAMTRCSSAQDSQKTNCVLML